MKIHFMEAKTKEVMFHLMDFQFTLKTHGQQ